MCEKCLIGNRGRIKFLLVKMRICILSFLETGQSKEAGAYESILAYSLYQKQNKKCVYCNGAQDQKYLDAIKSHWAEFNQGKYAVKGIKPIQIPEPKAICIGEAYGYKQYVSPWLIGPIV